MIAVVAVGAGCAELLVKSAMSLPLGVVLLAMMVVDARSKIAAVEAVAKIQLVDLLVAAMGAYRAVGA
jgi:hypothetical protein